MSAIELRRRLGDAAFADVLILLGREDLPLPRVPIAGRQRDLARAEEWRFGPMNDSVTLFVVDTGPPSRR